MHTHSHPPPPAVLLFWKYDCSDGWGGERRGLWQGRVAGPLYCPRPVWVCVHSYRNWGHTGKACFHLHHRLTACNKGSNKSPWMQRRGRSGVSGHTHTRTHAHIHTTCNWCCGSTSMDRYCICNDLSGNILTNSPLVNVTKIHFYF